MYREYRALTVTVACKKLYSDMGGRHKAQANNIHIIDVREISDHEVKRYRIKEFLKPGLRFRNPYRVPRAPTRRDVRVWSKKVPHTRYC